MTMVGWGKINSQIFDESKVTADAKIEDAKAQAEQMKLKAQEEGARQADTILKKSEADTASQKERVKSAIDLQRRTRLLEAKQEMIAEIIEKAYEKVINLAPDDESIRAARDAMNGWDPSNGCLYYYNPATATSRWMLSRPVLLRIGAHAFC